MRTIDNTCQNFFGSTGMIVNQRRRYLPDIEDGCPAKPGFYSAGPRIINRYRKDWEPDMKFWIPPYFMEADNWRAYLGMFYKNDSSKTIIGEVTVEYRLLNEHMSQ